MSVKAKAPKEDAETKRRREQAEARADTSRTNSTQRDLDRLTEDLLRTFGRRSSTGGLANPGSIFGGGGGGGLSGGGGGVGNGDGGSFDPGFSMLFDSLSDIGSNTGQFLKIYGSAL